MFANHTSGGFARHHLGRNGAGIARAEGNPANAPATGSALLTSSAQPSARHLAQMRLAGNRAGLQAHFVELMAEAGVAAARADAIAAGLAQVQQMTAPFLGSGPGCLDATTVAQIARRAIAVAKALPDQSEAAMTAEIARIGGEEAMAAMSSVEAQGRTYPVAHRVDAGHSRAEAMADGLLARMRAGHTPTFGREYATMRLEDLARVAGEGGGYLNGHRRSPSMVGGAMGTSDFAAALAIASNKVLLEAYEAAESQIKKASRQVSAPDFRPINTFRVSNGVELGKVLENGEFTHGQITDAGESFVLDTYGKIFALTRQAIVNDDLGAFEQSSSLFGRGAAQTEARIFAQLLEMNSGAGPTMSDNKALFHADHGNLAASGAVLSIDSLSAGRTAMRRQKGLAGEAIRVDPAMLIVPPELETLAEQLVTEISAATADNVNPFQSKLMVLTDANLTDDQAWYLAAMPGRPEGLQHAYLNGVNGPQVFTREGFETDASEFKVRLDFGAGFVDYRAWYKNPGA